MSENTSENKKKINRKKLPIAVVVLAILLLFALFLGFGASYDKVYPNTYLGGEKISGLTYGEATEKIENYAQKSQMPSKIKFTLQGEDFSVKAEKIDLAVDKEATLSGAIGSKSENIFAKAFNLAKSLLGKKELSLAFSCDEKKLNSAVSKFARDYEIPSVDTSYKFDGDTLVITKGHSGKTVDKTTLAKDVSDYVKNPKTPIPLKLKAKKEKKLDFDSFYEELTSDARNAYYAKDEEGNVVVIPDKPKVKVDKTSLKSLMESDEEEASMKVKTTPAKITEKALNDALFSGIMGSWTSYFSASNRPRTANVTLSAQRVDGTILMPGESFSYDKAVGPRTAKNGFQVAGVYINNKVEQGIGGGVCQTSSTLYSAVLYANLEIVSRTSHSLPVSYMPAGQDATIAQGSIDFVFKNNTDYPVKISATISGGSVTCKIIGTPVTGQKVVVNNTTTAVYEPKTQIETDPSVPKGYKKTEIGSKGSAVSSSRTVYQNGKAISTQRLTNSVYNATPTIITVNPEDKDVPPENLTEFSSAEQSPSPEQIEQEGEGVTAPTITPEEEIFEI